MHKETSRLKYSSISTQTSKDFCSPEYLKFSDVRKPESVLLFLDVPSPFKEALFWPTITSKMQKTKCKDKIPSVITSEACLPKNHEKNYWKKKNKTRGITKKGSYSRKRNLTI